MSNNQPNPLLSPPFFLIPGINPAAPISAQLEQIDQLNTLLLQEIDANFARFHQVVTSRILPEIKRFAIAGEPTREAAAFWRSFFEAAAAVRVPIPGDVSQIHSGTQDVTAYEDQTMTVEQGDESYLSARAREEGSFMFDPPPTSSTPLPNRAGGGVGTGAGADVSWDESMESPFDRMDRKLRDELNIADPDMTGDSGRQATSDMPTPSLPSGYSLPPLDSSGVSSHTFAQQDTTADEEGLVEEGTTPRAAQKITRSNANPFATAGGGSKWNGIADLRSTPLNPRTAARSIATGGKSTTKKGKSVFGNISDDDDFDDLQYAMSPPVTMTFNLPPRAQGILNAGRTPVKPASASVAGLAPGTAGRSQGYGATGASTAGGGIGGVEPAQSAPVADPTRVVEDLLDEITNGYVPSPRLPTPPGLGRYSIMPGELDAIIGSGRRLFEQHGSTSHPAPSAAPGPSTSASASAVPGRIRRSLANTSYGSDIQVSASDPSDPGRVIGDDDSFDEYGDDDTFSSAGGAQTMGMTDANAAAGAGFEFVDESYVTDAGDESGRYAIGPGGAGGEASLIFGHPANRAGESKFALMKPDEMVTFHGGRLEDARLTDSPTKGAQ